MKVIITVIFLMFGILCTGQTKDSIEVIYMSGNGPHNGICCGEWKDSIIMVWSYRRGRWGMLSDSVFYSMYPGYVEDSMGIGKDNREFSSSYIGYDSVMRIKNAYYMIPNKYMKTKKKK